MFNFPARQINAAKAFEAVRGGYVMLSVTYEHGGGKHIYISREYRKPEWHAGFCYHECYSVGPRGGVKQLYSHLY